MASIFERCSRSKATSASRPSTRTRPRSPRVIRMPARPCDTSIRRIASGVLSPFRGTICTSSSTIGPNQPSCTRAGFTSARRSGRAVAARRVTRCGVPITRGRTSIAPSAATTTLAASQRRMGHTKLRDRGPAGTASDGAIANQSPGMPAVGRRRSGGRWPASSLAGAHDSTRPEPDPPRNGCRVCYTRENRGRSSVGRALASQAGCRGFESLRPLFGFCRNHVCSTGDSRFLRAGRFFARWTARPCRTLQSTPVP